MRRGQLCPACAEAEELELFAPEPPALGTRAAEGSDAAATASSSGTRGVGDGPLDGLLDDRQAREAVATGDVDVGGDQEGAGTGDLLVGERGDPTGALGLDVQLDALVLGGVLERLGGHVGVGDPGGARGDREDDGQVGRGIRARGARRGRGGGAEHGRVRRRRGGRRGTGGRGRGLGGRLDDAHDEVRDLLGARRGARLGQEFRADQRPGELGQEPQVLVVGPGGCRDADHEVGGPIGRAEVHGLAQTRQAQRRLVHGLGAAVRDREAAGHAGGERLLALEEACLEAVAVGAAGRGDEVGHQADHGELVAGRVHVQTDEIGGHERCGHGRLLRYRAREGIGGGGGQSATTASARTVT